MQKDYYVYILVHANENMFKVGMSSNIIPRIRKLVRYWGSFRGSSSGSFLIKCDKTNYKNIERLILKHLEAYNIKNLHIGEGYTEFFRIKGLQQLIDLLRFLYKNNNCNLNFEVCNFEKELLRIMNKENSPKIHIQEKPIHVKNKIISVFNRKGGVGKTSLAYNIARDLNFNILSNDDSVIESSYDKALISRGINLFQCRNVVYDFGYKYDPKTIEILKSSNIILVPTVADINSLRKTLKTLNHLKLLNENVLIVGTKIQDNDLDFLIDNFDIRFALRESNIFQKSFIDRKSITDIVNESKINQHRYKGIYQDYSNLLNHIKEVINS